jgi:glycosyltransferase involved in cell wall biosynthesis
MPAAVRCVSSISIIICTRDRARALAETLRAIGEIALPSATACELLIVDNASTDDTAATVHATRPANALPIRLLREPRRGLAHARNTGLAAASGDVLVFTDDDVRPERDWLVRLSGPILAGQAEAVAGGVRLAPHLLRPWMSACHRAWLAATDDLDPRQPSRMVGANMAIARAVLARVPAFDPELGAGALGCGEETLFSLQLREAGFRIVAALDAIVVHHFEESRLDRAHWLAAARSMGRCDAYIAHHWEGAEWRRAWRGLLAAAARQAAWPLTRAVPESLLKATRHLHASLHFRRERRRPRNYTRRGLVRLSPAPTAP